MTHSGQNDASDGQPLRGYIDGCFDIMHSGHYNAIRQAKSICDVLVVGVHSDQEIAENKAMPVMKQDERYCLLDHIKWIDEIIYDVPYSPQLATLEKARADFCVHGDDMPVNAQGVCAYDEMRLAGRLRIIKRTEGVSTTDLIGRLLTMSRHQHTSEWGNQPLSPSNGVRVSSDHAIEQCSLQPCVSLIAGSTSAAEALADAMQTLDQIVAACNVPAADADLLRNKIQKAVGVASSATGALWGSNIPLEKAPHQGSLVTDDSSRTKAPVQLLASTRRIREFATARQPTAEDRVVYACGSFDMFHVGHAQFLKEARELGTFLLIGIYDDISVSRAKGSSLPVMNLNERVLNVCACKWVDEVIIGAPRYVTEDLIKTWQIHVVARGAGHKRNGVDQEVSSRFEVPKRLNIYREVPSRWPHLCHDTVVERIIGGRELYLKRNQDRARREDVYYESKNTQNSPPEG
jgi:ethanolamine-phosphate cytidylyltransferase